MLLAGGLGLPRELCSGVLRMFGIRKLCARASGVPRRMGKKWVLVCCVSGSTLRSIRARFVLVLLPLVCVGRREGNDGGLLRERGVGRACKRVNPCLFVCPFPA